MSKLCCCCGCGCDGGCGSCYCYTCCGGGGGCCSECVGSAVQQTELCSSCITGAVDCAPACGIPPGSDVGICTPTCFSVSCLPYAGVDGSGNDIYQNTDGSLVYTDGSPATRCDISCNDGACLGTPCSPLSCGTTDQAPHPCKTSGPSGGGSGGGSAKSAAGQPRATPKNCAATKLSQAMSKLGATMTSLLSGGKKAPIAKVLPGQAVQSNVLGLSSNAFLLVILVVGGLMLMMAFGHKPTGD